MENMDKATQKTITRISHSIGKYDLEIENELFKSRVYWARVIGSETESLFTQYTKHTFYEIQYALEGRIVMRIGPDEQITVNQSDFIVIPPDTFHQIIDGDSEGARFIMAFSLEVKNHCLAKLPDTLANPIPHPETKHMRSLLESIVQKNYHDEPVRRRLITSYLECFLLEVIEATFPYSTQKAAEMEQLNENEVRVMQIQRFIADRKGIGVHVGDIAFQFGISERHLNRIFVTVTGKTLKEAINRQKLEKIEELVATSTLSFREISELCGFSDEYAMSKFFKRYTFYTLTEYRALRAFKR